jgi:hypothetical protein
MESTISYPALTTAALFMALILLDLGKQQYKLLIGHFLFGIIAVLLMIYLSQNGMDLIAWGVFSIPIVMLLIGISIGYLNSAPGSGSPPPPVEKPKKDKKEVPCDASGNPLPAPPVTKCGPGSGGKDAGKTQCIDTSKLSSA